MCGAKHELRDTAEARQARADFSAGRTIGRGASPMVTEIADDPTAWRRYGVSFRRKHWISILPFAGRSSGTIASLSWSTTKTTRGRRCASPRVRRASRKRESITWSAAESDIDIPQVESEAEFRFGYLVCITAGREPQGEESGR